MTFIQPHKRKDHWNKILSAMAVVVVLATFWLVMSYNKVVSLDHGISNAKQSINKIQSQNAELKNQTFSLLDGNYLQKFALERNLVQDKNPQYLEVNTGVNPGALTMNVVRN